MFYCDSCADVEGWPKPPFGGSYGPCEMCGMVTGCNDVPSSHLPSKAVAAVAAQTSLDEQAAIASIHTAVQEQSHGQS